MLSDRPDRFVGDDSGEGFRQAARELPADNLGLLAARTLVGTFADTDDRDQAGFDRGQGFFPYQFTGFAMVLAAFGVSEDHPGRAGVTQHRGGDVAGVGSLFGLMAILAADRDVGPFKRQGNRGHMQCGGTNQQFRANIVCARGDIPGQGDRVGSEAVHLPVSGDQLSHRHVSVRYLRFSANEPGGGVKSGLTWRLHNGLNWGFGRRAIRHDRQAVPQQRNDLQRQGPGVDR